MNRRRLTRTEIKHRIEKIKEIVDSGGRYKEVVKRIPSGTNLWAVLRNLNVIKKEVKRKGAYYWSDKIPVTQKLAETVRDAFFDYVKAVNSKNKIKKQQSKKKTKEKPSNGIVVGELVDLKHRVDMLEREMKKTNVREMKNDIDWLTTNYYKLANILAGMSTQSKSLFGYFTYPFRAIRNGFKTTKI